MAKRVLTTESGAPVADNQNSASSLGGPLLLQDQHLLEKLARFNRERIPERVVHARGSGAYGYFEVTDDVTGFTRADFLSEVGKRTETFIRFSTVADSLGGADAVRDPRGFALKFYTDEGNYDLVGNNTPVFFIKDPIKFPDFIHSQKRDPFTGRQEPDNVWDFWAHSPEATHQVTWLMGDRGIPASYRHMNGYGSHTYQWTNAQGEAFFVKYHFKTNQGVRSLSADQAAELVGKDANSHQTDLLQAIERGVNPSWTLYVQVMLGRRGGGLPVQPVRPHEGVAARRLPAPAGRPPGAGPQPGQRLRRGRAGRVLAEQLRARHRTVPGQDAPGLFAYADAHRYRLGVNHTQLPVNAPRTPVVDNYGRDGLHATRYGSRYDKNYEPNSYAGPAQTDAALSSPLAIHGWTGTHEAPAHAKDDDFFQAGELYRLMSEDEKGRLVANIVLRPVPGHPRRRDREEPRPLPRRRRRLRQACGGGGPRPARGLSLPQDPCPYRAPG